LTTKKRSEPPTKAAPTKRKVKRTGHAEETPKRTAARPTATAVKKPRIHASHALVTEEARKVAPRRGPLRRDGQPRLKPEPLRDRPLVPAARKTLGGPKRATFKRPPPVSETTGPGAASRELALALAGAGIEKKAMGIEILDVTGRVDYADFLVIMTGRSDRHVHAIATGIEEAMAKRKSLPLSVEGLTQSTWVLIDFGDVVVHVFQEDARALYDIEGLWMDAGRVPVPVDEAELAAAKLAVPADLG
jgi:ribosome-associated protein